MSIDFIVISRNVAWNVIKTKRPLHIYYNGWLQSNKKDSCVTLHNHFILWPSASFIPFNHYSNLNNWSPHFRIINLILNFVARILFIYFYNILLRLGTREEEEKNNNALEKKIQEEVKQNRLFWEGNRNKIDQFVKCIDRIEWFKPQMQFHRLFSFTN